MGGAGEAGHGALQLMHCHLTETNARGVAGGVEERCTCVCRETFKFKPKIVADVATVPHSASGGPMPMKNCCSAAEWDVPEAGEGVVTTRWRHV